ncbi:MAG: alkaline phosphatase D family protein, partial [Paracoccaceae bacterium]
MSQTSPTSPPSASSLAHIGRLGPFLYLHETDSTQATLAALVLLPKGADAPPALHAQDRAHDWHPIATIEDTTMWRAQFAVGLSGPQHYDFDNTRYDLAGLGRQDMRIAYASCNGEEHGDMDRDPTERNAMWVHMRAAHEADPFSILLLGGDQVYADEVTNGHPLSDDWPDNVPDTSDPDDLTDLRAHLRRGFMQRYVVLFQDPDMAWMMARVPMVAMWDDHDICDGWGSLWRQATFSDVGQTLFDCAREAFLIFQCAATDDDIPRLCLDPGGSSLGRSVRLPGLTILVPDLRSERGRRQVMGRAGWQGLEDEVGKGLPERTLVMSSVPMLGPRLSVLEIIMRVIPSMQKYEDDLRDQWQSRAHRSEWRRMLRQMLRIHSAEGSDLTILSGEIHLATRAMMDTGGAPLHQLVASGVAHRPPPQAWARILGALAVFGEGPLAGHPIRIRPLPG